MWRADIRPRRATDDLDLGSGSERAADPSYPRVPLDRASVLAGTSDTAPYP